MQPYFSNNQIGSLIAAFSFLLLGLLLHLNNRKLKLSIILVILGGITLRVFISMLDSHLGLWDEQFHALVAKNMIDNPFKPMLYRNPIFTPDIENWTGSYIWLHKQPLFLWQMSLSIKLFGYTAFAVRLPSIIMSSLVIGFIYRIGKITLNRNTGFYASLLFAVSFFCLELVTGAIATDHNDIAFLFYVSASIWAWIEYTHTSNKKRKIFFLILIGLCSGAAILVKWLVGLLVYAGWGVVLLCDKQKRNKLSSYYSIGLSLLITTLIFLPWQIYISVVFPKESSYEYSLNTQHFFKVIEGHEGGYLYHFDSIMRIYAVPALILIFAIGVYLKRIKSRQYTIAILTFIIAIYLFFTLATTKMVSFTFCISFIGFLALGSLLDILLETIIINREKLKHTFYPFMFKVMLIGGAMSYFFNYEQIQKNHTMWLKKEDSGYYKTVKNNAIIKTLDDSIPNSEDYVIFNCREWEHIQIMFFNNVKAAYAGVPTIHQYNELKKKQLKLAIFDNFDLPEYILNDKNILILDKEYWK